MLSLLSSLTLALSAPAAVQSATPPTIVVTGQRIEAYRKRLADCLRRGCPPDEDIAASTALAEVLFISGNYWEARKVLRGSVGRNKREAKGYPVPLSELYRADARIARHLGLDKESQDSTRQTLRTLQAGIPVEDGRHFTARLEMVHALIFFGRYGEAESNLKELAEVARRAGYKDTATIAELQALWVLYKRGFMEPAKKELLAAAASPDPQRSVGGKILLIRMYGERGLKRQADALIKELGRGGTKRALLFEPEYQLAQYQENMGNPKRTQSMAPYTPPPKGPILIQSGSPGVNLADRLTDNFEDAWVDVTYRIRADGTVDDVEVIRRGPGAKGWEKPLLKALQGRRYTAAAKNLETQKIERFSYTTNFWDGAGSRIQSRSLRARVEKIELSSVDIPLGPG